MAGEPLDPGKRLPVQILVLLSLGLQVILFIFAGVRRHEASSGGRVLLLWLAYILADIVATYTLGRLSVIIAAGNERIVALWASFLLLHLGGPDNITAYELRDNELWSRQPLTLVSQVAGTAYILYINRYGSASFLPFASLLIFVVGVVKYAERLLALQRGNLGSIRDSLKKQTPAMHRHFHPQDDVMKDKKILDEESHVRRAHSLFHICKRAIVDSSQRDLGNEKDLRKLMNRASYWAVIEMELSLMYDILYTKAALIHTWHGYTIRVISPLAILTALLLFQFSEEDRHTEVDTAITYVLFGSALFMESTSLLNALGSSWMFATLSTTRSPWLRYKVLCSGQWDRLRRLVVSLNSLVTCGGSRYQARRWSGNMGQYNMLHFCTRPNTLTSPLLGRLASMVGLGEVWNRKHFSGTIKISDKDHVSIKVCISKKMTLLYTKGGLNSLGTIRCQWGKVPLKNRGLHKVFIFKSSLGHEFQEAIIIWHIGTDVFLAKSESAKAEGSSSSLVKGITVLSNYMMFLLVERPYMLPGIAQNRLYRWTCNNLDKVQTDLTNSSCRGQNGICAMLKNMFCLHDFSGSISRATENQKLAEHLYSEYVDEDFSHEAPRLTYAASLADQLLLYEEKTGSDALQLVLDVWTDMLIYAGIKGSRESHAKKLSTGGELTTILWLMAEHWHQLAVQEDTKQVSDEEA